MSNNVYDLKNAGKIKDNCSHCGLKYSKETGFYYGAMYVSYALAIALSVSIFVALSMLYPAYSSGLMISSIIIGLILAGPLLYGLSKIIWINFFEHYQERFSNGELLDTQENQNNQHEN